MNGGEDRQWRRKDHRRGGRGTREVGGDEDGEEGGEEGERREVRMDDRMEEGDG
jgi:hypothetical protein